MPSFHPKMDCKAKNNIVSEAQQCDLMLGQAFRFAQNDGYFLDKIARCKDARITSARILQFD